MADETKAPEMGETKEQPQATSTEMVQISAAELENIRIALKKANGEAAKYRKTAEQVEADRAAKEQAEMTALQKAEAKAKELEDKLTQLERARMQGEVAAKVGLPAKLASRLQGSTPEEMEADALEILETIPKQPAPQKQGPGYVPANPGQNGQTGEADAARRARLGLR
jgi:phage terminase Nu1 subunit (DNA packaging protein)